MADERKILGVISAAADLDAAGRVEGLTYGPRLLAQAPSAWRRLMRADAHYRSFGTLRFLLEEARERFESAPSFAREITSVVIDFVDGVRAPSEVHKVGLRGLAWKEHAIALEYAGDPRDALRAAERAVKIYGERPSLQVDETRARLVMSNILRDLGDLQQSLDIARDCALVFADFAEKSYQTMARMSEGCALFSLKRFREALAVFAANLEEAERAGDKLTLARALQNMAACARQLGDLKAARTFYPRALAYFNELGLRTEAERVRWGYALCLAVEGRVAHAASELYKVRATFLLLGMNTDAATAALDIVRVKWDAAQDVRELCSELVTTFAAAGMTQHAIEALAYLREQAKAGDIDATKIESVREYFGELAHHPSLRFSGPPEEEEPR
jgi:tetratricopeptide (TPR) repeat protein